MIIVITGPTCSNKSKIAIDVAKAFNAEIINADAFQVYKELDIGTAKPSIEDLKKVKHHLYSYLNPTDEFSIYDYQKDAREIIKRLIKRNKNIVLVGGSGLYIRAVLFDYEFKDNSKKIDLKKFDKLSNEELHKRLKKVDKESANKIHPNNRRRVFRALEIYYTYGKSKTELEKEQSHKIIYDDVHIYSTNVDKEILYKRIDERVIKMFDKGLMNEALQLEKKYGANLKSLQAIGYKEILQNKDKDKKEIIEIVQKNTRHYAKRQLTFIRYQFDNKVHYITSAKDIISDLTSNDFNSRTEALIGKDNLKKIKKASVAIFGIGGVGGTAIESLARSSVSTLYLIDHDKVNASNLNRQILFNKNDLDKDKVRAAKEHINKINPLTKVITYKKFISEENLNDFPFNKFDYVIDAIDSTNSKIALIKYCLKHKIPFISSLGMGNRLDPSKVIVTTLDKTHDDPLAKKLRNELKKENINLSKIKVVTSNEVPIKDKAIITSMMFVPSTAGLLIASNVIKDILNKEKKNELKKD